MHFFKQTAFKICLSVSITLVGSFAGFFSDLEKNYEYNKCLYSSSVDYDIIGGLLNYDSYDKYGSVIESWKNEFEIPLARNCKSVFDTSESVTFIETEPYEHDFSYNSFRIYSQTGSSWKALEDGKIFISSQLYYTRFGNRDYSQMIGKSVTISNVEYTIGGVFFVNHNDKEKRLISDYLYKEIGECAFVGKSFFDNNIPTKTLITFETKNKSIGEVYLETVNYFSKKGLNYSLFNKSDGGKINTRLNRLSSFYSSSYKIVLAVLFNVFFFVSVIISLFIMAKKKIKSPTFILYSFVVPCFLILLLNLICFNNCIYLLNKTSITYVFFAILLFSIVPIYTLVKNKSCIITAHPINVYYEEISI